MSEEWGPWIEHDGKGCPCVGALVHRVYQYIGINSDGSRSNENIGIAKNSASWRWGVDERANPIIRYRIRKPKGLTILEGILADLPASSPKQTVGVRQ